MATDDFPTQISFFFYRAFPVAMIDGGYVTSKVSNFQMDWGNRGQPHSDSFRASGGGWTVKWRSLRWNKRPRRRRKRWQVRRTDSPRVRHPQIRSWTQVERWVGARVGSLALHFYIVGICFQFIAPHIKEIPLTKDFFGLTPCMHASFVQMIQFGKPNHTQSPRQETHMFYHRGG